MKTPIRFAGIPFLILFLLLLAPTSQSREFVVDTTLDIIALDGQISLREAINAANGNVQVGDAPAGDPTGDIIAFSPKIMGGTIPLSMPIVLTENIDLRDDLAQRITLDGGQTLRILELASGVTSTVTGLLLTNGFDAARGGAILVNPGATLILDHTDVLASTALDGGGIFNDAGTLAISGSRFVDNTATGTPGSGGGIFNAAGGQLDIADSSFSNNTANRAGGAIEDQAGAGFTATITRVDFFNNQAGVPTAAPGNGGAIHITGPSNMTIQDGTVDGNFAAREGGGFWNGAGLMTINRTTFTNNDAAGPGADDGGGALFNNGGDMIVTDVLLDGNNATGASGSGGGLLSIGGMLSYTDTRIINNTSARAGGGIEIIDGTLTFLNGELSFNTTSAAPGNGGGLHVTGTNGTIVTVADSRVEGNVAAREGGGLWGQRGSTLNLTSSRVSDNVAQGTAADDGGGGLFNNGGVMTVTDSFIFNNQATGTGGSGGGLQNIAGGTVTISGTRFEANASMRAGGAIEDNAGGGITITDCDLVSNITGNSPGNGGGIHITGPGSVSITDSDVSRNSAGNEGGGLWNSGVGILNIFDTSVAFNDAPDGGGLFAQAGGTGVMTVQNSTIALNTASNGGGVQIEGGINNFTHSTIASNDATTTGGGFNITAGTVNLSNTLIGDNIAPIGADFNGTATSAVGVLLEDTTGATGVPAVGNITGADPMLMTYARTGDRTRTLLPMAGSPAIDTADPAAAATLAADQRNLPRPAGAADIGAAERQGTEIQIDVTTFADVVNPADGVTSLREAILQANAAAGPNVIGLQDGTYTLAIAGPGEDAAAAGDLDLTDEILLTGVGRGFSIIDAAGIDRPLHLIGAAATLEELDLANGLEGNGGGLENTAGTLRAFRVAFNDNTANANPGGSGGGLRNDVGGTIDLEEVVFDGNTANRAGGGIEDISGTAANILLNVDFFDNNAGVAPAVAVPGNGGAIHISGTGSMTITGGEAIGNLAAAEGGGFWNSIGTMDVTSTRFLFNDAQGAPADNGGGALFNNGGTLNVTNITATDNLASGTAGSGGGLLSTTGAVTITNSRFDNNVASRAGGAIELIEGSLSLDDSTLLSNRTGPAPGNGGAIHITGGANATINDSLVNDNTAAREGGGLWNGRGTMDVTGLSIIARNVANGPAADDGGGGIFNNGGIVNVTGPDVVVLDNTAPGASGSGGGIFNNVGGVLTVIDALIERNQATRAGGGIEDQSGPGLGITLDGAILDANITGAAPGNGGGLHITGPGDSLITGGTIARYNTASAEGGGLWNGTGVMDIDLVNVFGNTASGGPADQGGGGVFNAGGTINFNDPAWAVRGNLADGASGSGGGILNDGGSIDLIDGIVDYNLASRAGGGIEGTAAVGPMTLDGTQLNGNLTGAAPGNGGALHITGVGPVIASGVTVDGNCAASEGGGFWNNQGLMTISDSTFTRNDGQGASADNGGGGLFNNGGTLNVTNTLIASNLASGASGSGGGLLSVAGTVTLDNVTILTNTANRAGGGIEVIDGDLALTDSILNNNIAGPPGNAAPGNGGGIHVTGMNGGLVTVTRTDVKRNFAAREGGGLWSQAGSTMIVEDGTCLKGNLADGPAPDDGGGALFNNGGILIIDGSVTPIIVCSNAATGAAGQGGGLLSVGGSVTLDDTTLTANTSPGAGADTAAINGAKISPQFNVTSGDTLIEASAAYGQNFTGQTGGTDYDQLTATGPVDLTGSMLMITADPVFMLIPGTVYTLIDKSGTAPVTGTYAGLPEGTIVVINGNSSRISYMGNDGNDVILSALAPPAFADCSPSDAIFSACTTPADLPPPTSVLMSATSGCNVVTSFVMTAESIVSGNVVRVESFTVVDDCGLTGTCQRVFTYPADTTPPSFAACADGGVSQPGVTTFTAMADSTQEVPPVTNGFTGVASFTYDANAGTVSWMVTHTVTNASAAHIHGPAGPGMNAGVLVNLGSATSPIVGSAPITPADAMALLDGMAYLNIHSPDFPGGAIRGQLIPQPTGGTETITLTCGELPPDPGPVLASATDNCAVIEASVVASTNADGSVITHTFTAVDSAGNTGVCVQTFLLEPDTQPPAFAACASGTAMAPGVTALTATADSSQEVPPVTNAFSGTAVFLVNAAAGTVSWHITHDVTNAVAAHIHGPAGPGSNAGVLVNLGPAASPISGSASISGTDVMTLLDNMAYLNIHSPDFPAGAIRGQIIADQPGVKLLAANPTAAQEVPPATNDFSGNATFVLDTNNGSVSWFITHTVTNASAAHIHGPAGPGMNAGVLVDLGSATSPMSGTAPVNPVDAMTLMSGQAYLNIHSPDFPAGAIRGQMVMAGMDTPVVLDTCDPVVPNPADVLASATDNCGVTSTSVDETVTTNGTTVAITRVFTAVDTAGNTGTCTQVFTYELDTDSPTFTNCAPGTITLNAMPTPGQEVPPAANDFSGTATFTYDPAAGTVSWMIIHSVSNATAAHLHGPAGVGTNAGVLVDLGSATSPMSGTAPITPLDADALLAGLVYLNIHSPDFPAGAIRGQVLPAVTFFGVSASSGQEVPPVANPFSAAGLFTYDPSGGTITWDITHDVAGASAAHIHGPASPGMNAGVLVNLGPATSPINGTAAISPADAAILLRGDAYLNIHSPDFPAGAVRGQLAAATDLGCNATVPPADNLLNTATDNCGVVATSAPETLVTNGCQVVLTRTYLARDAAGNVGTCVRAVTYNLDSTPPAFAAPPLITLGCNPGTIPATDAVFAGLTDDCGLISSSVVETAVTFGCTQQLMRVFTATDTCDNTTSFTQMVVFVDDMTPPDFSGCDVSDQFLGCNPTVIPDPVDLRACADDTCGIAMVIVTEQLDTGSVVSARAAEDCSIVLTRTYTIVDACGNTNTATQALSWFEDTEAPDLSGCDLMDLDLGCNPTNIPPPISLGGCATDFCSTLSTEVTAVTVTTGCSRVMTRVYTVEDGCSNSGVVTQRITWTIDSDAPIISACDVADMDLGCNPSTIPDPVDASLCATDECAMLTCMVSATVVTTGCARVMTRIYTIMDDCANASTATQTIIWTVDETSPDLSACTITDLNLGCNPDTIPGPVDLTTCATDNCGDSPSISVSSTTVTTGCARVMTRIYTSMDDCANASTATQSITWTIDETPPDLSACNIPSMDLGLNPTIPPAIDPATCATDNCGNPSGGSVMESITNDGCNRTLTRTYTSTNACGLVASVTQTLTYQVDDADPGITCPAALMLQSSASTSCQATLPTVSATATDGCGNLITVTQSPPPGTVLNGPGPHMVTLSATAANGQSVSCPVRVDVECAASIAVTKEVTLGTDCARATDNIEAPVGATITFCFTVQNTGQLPVTNIRVTDLMLQRPVMNRVVINSLAPGATDTFILTDTFNAALTNVAAITFDGAGDTDLNIDSSEAVVTPGAGKITGWTFRDINNNGSPDDINLGMIGLTGIALDLLQNGTVIDRQTSGGNDGSYAFCDLLAGTYTVRVDLDTVPVNLRDRVNRTSATATITRGQELGDVNFAFVPIPTAITLASETAVWTSEGVHLSWTTATETDTIGFEIHVQGESVGDLILATGGGTYTSGPIATAHGDTIDIIELDANFEYHTIAAYIVAPPQLEPVDSPVATTLNASALVTSQPSPGGNILVTNLAASARLIDVQASRQLIGAPLETPAGRALYFNHPKGNPIRLR